MRYAVFDRQKDIIILIARVFLMILFVLFGLYKLIDFSSSINYMASESIPFPAAAAAVSVFIEFFVGIAIIVGFYTRPLALIFAIYALATGLVGHHFWTMADAERMANMINFYKNISIVGGLLLLYVTGAGKY